MPMQSLKQYIAYAKAHPGEVNFGSSGVGGLPPMSVELLMSVTGMKIVHVPYKADMNKLLASGTPLQKSLEDQAVDVSTASPEKFAAHVKSEIAKWSKVVRDSKLEAK